MITLYKNVDGKIKLVDFGTKADVGFYTRLGYTVKVLNADETVELRAKLKSAAAYRSASPILKHRLVWIINNTNLNWSERLRLINAHIAKGDKW